MTSRLGDGQGKHDFHTFSSVRVPPIRRECPNHDGQEPRRGRMRPRHSATPE
jgi:hypothetical protein